MMVDDVDAHRHEHGVEPICLVLTKAGTQIAPSTYDAAKTRPASARSVCDATTTEQIANVYAENYGVYGVRKVHAELSVKATGWPGPLHRGPLHCGPG